MITDEENDKRNKLMEEYLQDRSLSTKGYFFPLLRDERVIPRIPRPIPGEYTDVFVRRNKDLLLRLIEDAYLALTWFWNPVNRTRSEFILCAFRAPQICQHLEIPHPSGIAVLKDVFGLNNPSRDYISTTNYFPVHVLAGAAFLFQEEHPWHYKLWINAMFNDPVYFMQARYILSLTPCRSYHAKGMPPRPPPRPRPLDSQEDLEDKEKKNQESDLEGQRKEVPGSKEDTDNLKTKEATEEVEPPKNEPPRDEAPKNELPKNGPPKDEPPKDDPKEDPQAEPKVKGFQKLIRGTNSIAANLRKTFRGLTGRKKKERSTIPPEFANPDQGDLKGDAKGDEEKAKELKANTDADEKLKQEETLREQERTLKEEPSIPTVPVPAKSPPPESPAEPFDGYDYMNKCTKALWDACEELESNVIPPPERPDWEDSSDEE